MNEEDVHAVSHPTRDESPGPPGETAGGPPGFAARTVLAGGASQVRRAGAPEPVRGDHAAKRPQKDAQPLPSGLGCASPQV